MTKEGKLRIFAWGLSGFVALVAVFAWGSVLKWNFSTFNSYFLFPLFGLLAFCLMWSHYIAAAARKYIGAKKEVLADYFEATSLLVLFLILLHPGLLAFQLWQDGQGLPPGSEINYVAPTARWAVILGFISLTIFLVYELRRLYQDRSWWKYVQYTSDIAMIFIYIHALRLGGALTMDWFRIFWYVLGATFLVALTYIHAPKNASPLE